jgi:hypothetical protein
MENQNFPPKTMKQDRAIVIFLSRVEVTKNIFEEVG